MICNRCRKITNLEKFKGELGGAYAQAISDKEFLDYLQKEAKDHE